MSNGPLTRISVMPSSSSSGSSGPSPTMSSTSSVASAFSSRSLSWTRDSVAISPTSLLISALSCWRGRRPAAAGSLRPLRSARPRPFAPLRSARAEQRAQANGVAHRAQSLVGDDDAQIGKVERAAIVRQRNARHVGDDVVELQAQHVDEDVDGVDPEAQLVAQRLLRAEHEEAL